MSATSSQRPPMIGRVMTTPSISAALAGLGKNRGGHKRTSSQVHAKQSPPSNSNSSPKQNGSDTIVSSIPQEEEGNSSHDHHPSPPIQPWLSRPKSTTSMKSATSMRPSSIASTVRPPSVSSVASSSAPRAIEEGEWDYAPESPLFFVCPEEEARRDRERTIGGGSRS